MARVWAFSRNYHKERVSLARYEIHGGRQLNGAVTISGAKNAAVAIIPATLLVSGKCRIENVPDISDVRILLDILDGMGAKVAQPERNVVAKNIMSGLIFVITLFSWIIAIIIVLMRLRNLDTRLLVFLAKGTFRCINLTLSAS